MKNSIRKFLALVLIGLLTACVPALEITPTARLLLIPTGTTDPNAFSISAEINQRTSNEEIMNILFSQWLDHLRSKKISPYWRVEAYDIEDISESALDRPCGQKLGALFLLEVLVYIKTTDPIFCPAECEHSAWTAGGGNPIDAFSQTKPFSGAVFKSGNIYTLNVITAIPPCDLSGN